MLLPTYEYSLHKRPLHVYKSVILPIHDLIFLHYLYLFTTIETLDLHLT